jgi:hypothetical protein
LPPDTGEALSHDAEDARVHEEALVLTVTLPLDAPYPRDIEAADSDSDTAGIAAVIVYGPVVEVEEFRFRIAT